MKLRARLKNDNLLYSRFQVIETKARQLLEYSQGGAHLSFTPHGLSHVSAVEANFDWLLSDEDIEAFTTVELFILLTATLFHDALMLPKHLGDETESRAQHVNRAKEFLRQHAAELGLQLNEAHAIGETIRGHAVERIDSLDSSFALGPNLLDLRKLGACLSVADICHADESRAPYVVFQHLNLDEESAFHWRRHIQISGITRNNSSLLISALVFSDEGEEAVSEYKNTIERQLESVKPYFSTRLRPIDAIDLQLTRLNSPLEQSFGFKANMPAILDLLIEGVYQRSDVLIREIVQNSLDACLIRRAKAMRRNDAYIPTIVVSLLNERGAFAALRVDDNGIGMDVADIRDILLWIGSTISERDSVKELLGSTVQKNLIATFGIGLLSCFKVARKITIRTRKESGTPLELTMTDISGKIIPSEATDVSIGTTIVVEFTDEAKSDLDGREAVKHYFRDVHQVDLRLLESEWSPSTVEWSRPDVFAIAVTEAQVVTRQSREPVDALCSVDIKGETFSGYFWISDDSVDLIIDAEPEIEILSEGIYVTSIATADWLPEPFRICRGVLNFSAQAIDLPASRDGVKNNRKLESLLNVLSDKCINIIESLVALTSKSEGERESAALLLSHMHQFAPPRWRRRILDAMSAFRIELFPNGPFETLASLKGRKPERVYFFYPRGRFVKKIQMLDGRQLYEQGNDHVTLQATMLAQRGQYVIKAARQDLKSNDTNSLYESELLSKWCEANRIPWIDLAKDNVIEGTIRSKPVSKGIRETIGPRVKFVELPGIPNRRVWNNGGEVWVNLANPAMKRVYDALQEPDVPDSYGRVAKALLQLLSLDFQEAADGLIDLLESHGAD